METGYYQHFKGGFYKVIGMATHTETNENLVLYVEVGKDFIWARPLTMFCEMVEHDGKKVRRFEWLRK